MASNVTSALDSLLTNGRTFYAPLADKGSGEVSLIASGAGASQTPTFTRATTATTFDSSGTLVSVATGVARSYYDPTTLAYQGYLAEGARTNLVLNSLLNGTDFSTQSVTVAAVAHTLSFYGTGTITLSGVSTAGPLVGTGVYPQRVTLTFTPTAGVLTLTVTGSCKYVNLEAGSFASSFIPTAGAAVTRNDDVLTYPSAGNVSATEGTIYLETRLNQIAATAGILCVDDTTQNEAVQLWVSANTTYFQVVDGGVSQAAPSPGTMAAVGVDYRVAVKYKVNDFAVCGNGGTVGVDTAGTIPTVTTINFSRTAGNLNAGYGTLKNVRIYATAMTDAQLQAITA